MNINKIPNVFKVADVVVNAAWNKMVQFNFCVDTAIQKDKRARIYVLVSDNKIIKIGGSADKGGIKQTLRWYQDGFSGSPDDKGRTLGVPTALLSEIQLGKKVEVYMIFAPSMEVNIEGITKNAVVSISGYKNVENVLINQYMEVEGVAPALNMQENKYRHPDTMLNAIHYYLDLVAHGASTARKPKTNSRAFTKNEQTKLLELVKLATLSYNDLLK